jgi:chromosome segregation ATPase
LENKCKQLQTKKAEIAFELGRIQQLLHAEQDRHRKTLRALEERLSYKQSKGERLQEEYNQLRNAPNRIALDHLTRLLIRFYVADRIKRNNSRLRSLSDERQSIQEAIDLQVWDFDRMVTEYNETHTAAVSSENELVQLKENQPPLMADGYKRINSVIKDLQDALPMRSPSVATNAFHQNSRRRMSIRLEHPLALAGNSSTHAQGREEEVEGESLTI